MKAELNKEYRLIKAPSMMKDWVDHTFQAVSVTKEEIVLKETAEGEWGFAVIAVSPDEFSAYFKPVTENTGKKCKAREWSEWETIRLYGVTYAYKQNGKRVIVRSSGFRGESSCHDEDEFDLEYGLKLAVSRLNQNRSKGRRNERVMRFGC